MSNSTTQTTVPPALHQTSQSPDRVLHSGNAGVIVERVAQIRGGQGGAARRAAREIAEHINAKHAGTATVFVYEETFGVKNRLHWLLHFTSYADYGALLAMGGPGGDIRGGVFGAHEADVWDELFEAGSVRETVMLPHRWGIFGTATEAMAADPAMSPIVPGEGGLPRFDVRPAQEQTAMPADKTLNSATAGVVMRRTVDFDYRYRAEARVFARTVAENMNLNMDGLATVFLYEEAFGRMDRAHFLIHMRSLDVMYLLMGLDARTDPDAPRASFIQDWISMDKGGGAWDKIIVQGTTRDVLLTPQHWG
ncbi:DUF6039 family protein [Microbispora sp. NPDC046973]|uniref:DUF6039 family protein n=1 Tax=Microbispora sp. NPDC046973 TaxID=3155022 RepID=UPI003405DCB9